MPSLMLSLYRWSLAGLALVALAVYGALAGGTATHARPHGRRVDPSTAHRLADRQAPVGAEFNDISDDDDDAADDDAGTSPHAGISALPVSPFVLVDTFLFLGPPRFPSLLPRDHVHATRGPPRRTLPSS